MKVLVVDDSKAMRMIVIRTLKQAGISNLTTIEANNGVEALATVADEKPHAILSDWNMPEMKGIEFIRAVRKDPRLSHLVLLMVTTETEPEQMLKAMLAGADEYLMKPFVKECLIEKLQLLGVVH